ncbi:hypothetical protein ES702_01753 [subsurface metagenome]
MNNIVEQIKDEESISRDVVAGTVAVPTTDIFYSKDIPSRSAFYLTHFANFIDVPEAWGSITWSVRVNGMGVRPPFDAIKDQYGLAAEPRPIVPIEARGGDKIEIVISNTFPATVGVGLAIRFKIGKTKE